MVNFTWFTDEKIFSFAVPSRAENGPLFLGPAVLLSARPVVHCQLFRPGPAQPVFSLGILQERRHIKDVCELQPCIAEVWDQLDQTQFRKQLHSGERDFEHVWLKAEHSLNTKCEHFPFTAFCV